MRMHGTFGTTRLMLMMSPMLDRAVFAAQPLRTALAEITQKRGEVAQVGRAASVHVRDARARAPEVGEQLRQVGEIDHLVAIDVSRTAPRHIKAKSVFGVPAPIGGNGRIEESPRAGAQSIVAGV